MREAVDAVCPADEINSPSRKHIFPSGAQQHSILLYLVCILQRRSVEESLRPAHVRVGHPSGLRIGQGEAVSQALLKLFGGFIVHTVHHV